jgi:hypothetical protein
MKYLVVSYGSDQQEWFHDFVESDTPENATAYVCKVRSYVDDAEALSMETVQSLATDLANELDWNTSVPLAQCQDCREQFPVDKLLPIEDIGQRVAPGEPMPAGECPSCFALCQLAA